MHKTIEKRLRDHFPILFNHTNSVDQKEYRKEFKTFIDDAISISNPILSAEAIRYQSILLYVSLIFAALHFLNVEKLKLADLEIPVSNQLFIVYACFIAMVSLAFAFKARFDYRRWSLIRQKHSDAAVNLQDMVAVGLLRKQVEHYFWNKAYNMIDACHDAVGPAMEKVLSGNGYKNITFRPISAPFDISGARTHPDLAPVIAAKDAWLNDLQTELNVLIQAFQAECELILADHEVYKNDPSPFKSDDSYNRINAAYQKRLAPWIIARNSLIDEMFSRTIKAFGNSEEHKLLTELNSIFAQLKNMRVMYVTAEILLPILFAISIPAFVIWSR